jgi:hypothetical protein
VDAALKTATSAAYYRIMGVEITASSSMTLNYGLVLIDSHETSDAALQSNNIILDRVYIHGHGKLNLSRCVNLNGAHNAVIDSYLSECHGKGYDTQAILSYNGTGPFKIVNNYLEGAGENIMFGGADTRIPNNVPSDIEIRGNHLFKPLLWKGVWTVKNSLELKNARRVLITGNVLENNWGDAQIGFSVLFTPRNQNGTNPWTAVQDVTFEFNVIRNSAHGINILGADDIHPSQTTKRITIRNNLIEQSGRAFQLNGGVDLVIINNTIPDPTASHVGVLYGDPVEGFVYRDNVSAFGRWGIHSDVGSGTAALEHYAPGYQFSGNAFFGEGWSSTRYQGSVWVPTLADVRFVNPATGDYSLASDSPFRGRGSGGSDPGADFVRLRSAIAGTTR